MRKLIMFDMDGTLVDTFPGLHNALNDTLEHFGMDRVTAEECMRLIGPRVYHTFYVHYDMPEAKAREMTDHLRKVYVEKHMFDARLYDGIDELLKTLKSKGFGLAIMTNKRYDYAEQIAEHFGISQYFDRVYGMDFADSFEKYQIMGRCLSNFGIGSEDALMVGDTVWDKEAAEKCNVDFIPVSYGFGKWEKGEGCADTKELERQILGRYGTFISGK